MMPELTKPMSITVTAEEDWIMAVITAPSVKLFTGLDVIFTSLIYYYFYICYGLL